MSAGAIAEPWELALLELEDCEPVGGAAALFSTVGAVDVPDKFQAWL